MYPIKIFNLIFGLLLIYNLIDFVKALKCRIAESPSDEEMKKVIHKCMRKIGSDNKNNFNNYIHHNYYQNNRDFNNEYHSSSSSDSDEQDNSNRLKNREHLQMRVQNRNKRFSNNEQKRQQQNDRRNGNGNGNGNTNNNQRNNNNNNNGYERNGNNNGTEMIDRQNENDRNCIVHCFFEEMNMLNNDDYPDKYKVLHILTKDVREHDLREFYTDSIQECFHFLDMEQRKDKCLYSKTLINCMTDYARANCEDWQEHTIVFN